jgi:glutathione S-transferase/GST-like protein
MTGVFKLYGRPGSGSGVCEAVLALSGLRHEIFDFDRWGNAAPPAELLAVNPLGQIPALVMPDGGVMTESGAIALYLADLIPDAGLAPLLTDPRRAKYLRWMVYLAANSYMTALRIYYPERFSTRLDDCAGVKAAAIARSAFEWSVFAHALGDGPFILGGQMSAADIYAAMLASWDLDPGALFKRHPSLERLCLEVGKHPTIKPVWLRHEI